MSNIEEALLDLDYAFDALFNGYMQTDEFGNNSVYAKSLLEKTKRRLIKAKNKLKRELNNENESTKNLI